MIDTSSFVYGAVFVIEFPYSDNPKQWDLRPAVVVSNEDFNAIWSEKKVVAAYITTKQPVPLNQYHLVIQKGTEEYKLSGLKQGSYIRLDKLITVDFSAIKGYLGKLPEEFMKTQKVGEICKSIF